MPRKPRLVLNRESLTPLEPDELHRVAGAGISRPNLLCELSLRYSDCADTSCGIACTQNQNCVTAGC